MCALRARPSLGSCGLVWKVTLLRQLEPHLPTALFDLATGLLELGSDEAAVSETPSPDASTMIHPAGITRNWSALYVWLQYIQWYKVRHHLRLRGSACGCTGSVAAVHAAARGHARRMRSNPVWQVRAPGESGG